MGLALNVGAISVHPLFGLIFGVHGSGVGAGGGADGNVKALLGGRKGISIMPNRDGEDVYSPVRCVEEGVQVGGMIRKESMRSNRGYGPRYGIEVGALTK